MYLGTTVAQKANSIKNGFAKYFIIHDTTTNPKI